MKTTAVIVGAGSSTRMGKTISKQLIKLCGKEVIVHTMTAFEKSEYIDEIVVVCREEDIEIIKSLAQKYNITKAKHFAKGGSTRQQSVKNGVNCIKNADYVAIHDGARPLVTAKIIDSTIKDAIKHSASAPGVAVKDTIKIVDDNGFIQSTPDRSKLVAIQTPQVFKMQLYKNSMAKAEISEKDYTDDCQLVEAMGGVKVFVSNGSYTNIKVTTPDDIAVAESILCERKE